MRTDRWIRDGSRRGRRVHSLVRSRHYRRTRLVAAGLLIAGASPWIATTGASASPPPGEGSATAYTLAVLPKEGALSVGVTLGEALAGHTNGEAKAQSQTIDLGSIGTSLTSYNCNAAPVIQPTQLPQPLIVETGQPGAAAGVTDTDDGGAFTQFGKANSAPYAEAVTTTAPIGLAGIIDIGAGVATSWSGLVNGQRQAGSTVNIASITLPAGISLEGLQWTVVDQTTGTEEQTGTFSIAKATIGGMAVPTTNPTHLFDELNALIEPLGLSLLAPTAHLDSGIEFIDPLEISVIPNATRDSLLNTVLTGIQPITSDVIAATLNAVCDADTAITVLDVALASIDGGGALDIVLGGAQATSGAIAANGYDLTKNGGYSLSVGGGTGSIAPTKTGGDTLSTESTSIIANPGSLSPIVPASAPLPTPAAAVASLTPASVVHGKRGGALAVVGLIGLVLLAAVAEADRRKMRRAQRTISLED